MKPHLWAWTIALLLTTQNPFAQQYTTNVNNGQPANEMMEVKQKFLTNKYEFGPYRIVSAQKGFTTTKGNKLFRRVNIEQTSNSSSFLLVGNETDTVLVMIELTRRHKVTKSHSLIYENGKFSRPTEREVEPLSYNLSATIKVLKDGTYWQLSRIINYTNQDSCYFGLFNDTNVLTVSRIGPQKENLLYWDDEFEFSLNDQAVATVNLAPTRTAWIDYNLDPKIKLPIAAALATMLFVYKPTAIEFYNN